MPRWKADFDSQQALQKVQGILRDDGLSFRLHPLPARQDGDYVEQLTFLLLLTVAMGSRQSQNILDI
ncbi:MAG TPA: hypothetical protein VJA21_30895 [Verrucomicrobiae bacterium]